MAREIKDTPVLTGNDAQRFLTNLENPRQVSAKEIEEARQTYEVFKSISTFKM